MLSDTFLKLEEVGVPDERWQLFVSISPNEEITVKKLEDWYKSVSMIQCDVPLSETLQKRLNEIKNLLIYSWFVYSFASTAFLMSLLLAEAYLREQNILKKGQNMGNLIHNHKQQGQLPENIISRLEALVSLRNRLAHSEASLHSPGSMLMSVQSTLEVMSILTNASKQ